MDSRMQRFKSPEQAQRFLEVHDLVASHFRPKWHQFSVAHYRVEREQRFQVWRQITIS
jgi:putative transposase